MSRILTGDELKQLTGASTKRKQIEVLKQNGISFLLNASGSPVVLWSSVENRTSSGADKAAGHKFGALSRAAA